MIPASKQKTVYVVCGPTAAGKTAVAIELALRLQTSIVSADSRQCYKEMSIGTAKPAPEDLLSVPHYFIDVFPVTKALTAADYETLAIGYLDEIFATNDSAVVCGGTGLYIKALCDGLDDMPAIDAAVQHQVNKQYSQLGLEWLRTSVGIEDPAFYMSGETENPARLLRALIFVRSTGKSILDFRSHTRKKRNFNIVKTGLELPREVLYDRINLRVESMMAAGLLQEAEGLYPYRDLKNLQTVGYSELFAYIDGLYPLNEAVRLIKQNTRHYAKRQMTWFKKDDEVRWLPADSNNLLGQILHR